MTADILVVIPTLGRRLDTLTATFESIVSQNGPSTDIVLVSPDDATGARDLAETHGAVLATDPGTGMSPALSVGLAAAGGQRWFAWLNDDDILTPGSLAATSAALASRPDAAMVYGDVQYMDPAGLPLTLSRAGRLAAWLFRYGPNLIPQPGSLARLDAVLDVGGIDDSLQYAMDQDLFLRLRGVGPIIHVPRTVARYTWHPNALTVENRQASILEAERVRHRYQSRWGSVLLRPADIATRATVRYGSDRVSKRALLLSELGE